MATTLQNLLDDFRLETRDPNGQLFQDEDAAYAINKAYIRCYSFVLKLNKDYFLTTDTINLVAGTRAYPLPANFVRMKRVEYIINNSTIPLFERIRGVDSAYTGPSSASIYYGNYTYEFEDDNIIFEPTPQVTATGVIKITYYPSPVEMADVSETIDSAFKDHWTNYIILEAINSGYAQIEALGGRISKSDIKDRLDEAKETVRAEVALRTLSPRIRRRRKYFR